MLKIIDQKTCEFIASQEQQSMLSKLGCQERGTESSYIVVAIIGPQCSGKSTFLNGVFGSNFTTLPPQPYGENIAPFDGNTIGQIQTTQGTWVSLKRLPRMDRSPVYLLIDNEGCDGGERLGDTLFEKRSALFSLVLSDVLIINTWTSDIGRFAAANFSLLETIIEVYLPFFSKDKSERLPFRRPVLMFILRDHTSGTLLQHRNNIMDGVQRVLNEALVNSGADNSPVDNTKAMNADQIFDIRVYSLPHYYLQREDFDKQLCTLRENFDPSSESCIFKCGKNALIHELQTRSKSFPLKELFLYMRRCWELITQHEDLDLPSRKYIVAEIRCERIMKRYIDPLVENTTQQWMQSIRSGVPIRNIESEIELLCTQGLEILHRHISHFPQSISQKYSAKVTDILQIQLRNMFFPLIIESLSSDLNSEIRVTLKSVIEKSMQMSAGGWNRLRTCVSEFHESIFIPYARNLIAEGYLGEQCDSNEHCESLYALLEEKFNDIISKEIHLQLKTMSHIDEAPTVMIQIFRDAYESTTSKLKASKHHDENLDTSYNFLIDATKQVFHVGIDYLNNIVYNRYRVPISSDKELAACIHYQVDFESISSTEETINENQVISLKYTDITIDDGSTWKDRDFISKSTRPSGKAITLGCNPDNSASNSFADRHKISTVSAPTIEQILRLYIQGVSHVIEMQREKERYLVQQQALSRSMNPQVSSLKNIPFWVWFLVLFYMADSIFGVLSTSIFWVLLLAGCYFYLVPLFGSLKTLNTVRSVLSKSRYFVG